MPTKREREYYAMGYRDGIRGQVLKVDQRRLMPDEEFERRAMVPSEVGPYGIGVAKPRKRKMSAWNKYVKANSKKPRFRYRNGKLNLKKMGVAFRKTPAGKKKR